MAEMAEGGHLVDVVREKSDAPLDWDLLKDEAAYGLRESLTTNLLDYTNL
jgi:hypothetical protein